MKLIRLTALFAIAFTFLFSLSSCEKDAETKKVNNFSKTDIALTGAQETPPNPSTGTGSMNVSYTKGSKVLTYSVSWQNLTDTIVGIHIHGLAPAGFGRRGTAG